MYFEVNVVSFLARPMLHPCSFPLPLSPPAFPSAPPPLSLPPPPFPLPLSLSHVICGYFNFLLLCQFSLLSVASKLLLSPLISYHDIVSYSYARMLAVSPEWPVKMLSFLVYSPIHLVVNSHCKVIFSNRLEWCITAGLSYSIFFCKKGVILLSRK